MPREVVRARRLRRLKSDSVRKERPRANLDLCSTAVAKRRLNRDLRLARVRRKFKEPSSELKPNLTLKCLVNRVVISSRYGISYHGAAQAASGTKEQVASYREKNRKLFEQIGQFSRSNRGATSATDVVNINDIGRGMHMIASGFHFVIDN